MHEFTAEVEALAREILAYSLDRLKNNPPLDGPRTAEDLFSEIGNTITARGLGGHQALEIFTSVLAKACISSDHPRNLAFIPSAPSEYASLFDLVVGASALYGGSWQEGAGAGHPERWCILDSNLNKRNGLSNRLNLCRELMHTSESNLDSLFLCYA